MRSKKPQPVAGADAPEHVYSWAEVAEAEVGPEGIKKFLDEVGFAFTACFIADSVSLHSACTASSLLILWARYAADPVCFPCSCILDMSLAGGSNIDTCLPACESAPTKLSQLNWTQPIDLNEVG